MGIQGFVNAGCLALSSSQYRVQWADVTQGGNYFLATGPLAGQAMWTGMAMGAVASAVSGPLSAIARLFQIILNPFISFPIAFASCMVKENFYESSAYSKAAAIEPQYYALGKEVHDSHSGTVTLNLEGIERHFLIGENIDYAMKNSVEHAGKRYECEELKPGESFDKNCREITRDGEKINVRLLVESLGRPYIEQEIEGKIHYFAIGDEVGKPIARKTVTIKDDGKDWFSREKHYEIQPIEKHKKGCATIRSKEQKVFFRTGQELDTPKEGSYELIINGERKYFSSAKIASQEFPGVSGALNRATEYFTGYSFLPTRLSKISKEALLYINENFSDVLRVAIAVSGVVLVCLGQMATGAGILTVAVYEYLDHDLGVIPQKVSIFMEKWMPTISMVGLLIVGSAFTQVTAGITLLLTIPSVQQFMHHKISALIRGLFSFSVLAMIARYGGDRTAESSKEFTQDVVKYPGLEEFDAPFTFRKDLNAREIRAILNSAWNNDSWKQYEINPSYLTKFLVNSIELPENRNFDLLLEIWDKQGKKLLEKDAYNRMLKKLAKDNRFINFLQKSYREVKRFHFEYDSKQPGKEWEQQQAAMTKHLSDIEKYIEKLAQQSKVTKEQFVADYYRKELQIFVNKLKGSHSISGSRSYLQDAIDSTSRLIPFLLDDKTNEIQREDALEILAVEAADYCSLRLKMTTQNVLQGFLQPVIEESEKKYSESEQFARECLRRFEKERVESAMEKVQYSLVSGVREENLENIMLDVHLNNAITRVFKRTFCPMTEQDIYDFSLTELIFADTIALYFRAMIHKEAFEKGVPEIMEDLQTVPGTQRNRVLEYLRDWAQKNDRLEQAEKDTLLNGDGLLTYDAVLEDADVAYKWHVLMLMTMGILRKKQAA